MVDFTGIKALYEAITIIDKFVKMKEVFVNFTILLINIFGQAKC